MGDVELGDDVEEVDFLDLAVVGEVVEEFADVWGAGDHLLHYFAECFEDGGVVDGGEEELNVLDLDGVLGESLL